MAEDAPPFPYMRWAQANLHYGEPLMLGMSGLSRPPDAERLGLTAPVLPSGEDPERAWLGALAARLQVAPECVYATSGTSQANFLVYLTLAQGGRVVSESPAYDAFFGLGKAVGADVVPFRRDPARDWRIDPDHLRKATAPGADLLVVTDLHNPSGKRLHPDDLALLLEQAHAHDAYVLVDEVYLDLDPRDRPTAALVDERVLVTNSLTKSHGLWDLRAGWILAAPEVVSRIAAWDDLVCPRQPLLPMLEALKWMPHIDAQLARTRARCAELTDRVDAWVNTRADVWWVRPDAGFTAFLHLGTEDAPLDGDTVAERAWELARVRVVPGSFFQSPRWLRISYWLPDARLDAALAGLGQALDAVSSSSA